MTERRKKIRIAGQPTPLRLMLPSFLQERGSESYPYSFTLILLCETEHHCLLPSLAQFMRDTNILRATRGYRILEGHRLELSVQHNFCITFIHRLWHAPSSLLFCSRALRVPTPLLS